MGRVWVESVTISIDIYIVHVSHLNQQWHTCRRRGKGDSYKCLSLRSLVLYPNSCLHFEPYIFNSMHIINSHSLAEDDLATALPHGKEIGACLIWLPGNTLVDGHTLDFRVERSWEMTNVTTRKLNVCCREMFPITVLVHVYVEMRTSLAGRVYMTRQSYDNQRV